MTTTPPTGITFLQAAKALAAHLANHQLPEPVSLSVVTSHGDSMVTAQLRAITVPGIAADLLAWADSLSVVTVEAWWPSEHDRVHLTIRGTLTSPAGVVELKVFGGVDYDPLRFADLRPDQCQDAPLSLGQLHGGRPVARPPPVGTVWHDHLARDHGRITDRSDPGRAAAPAPGR